MSGAAEVSAARRRVEAARDELRRLRSSDPAAAAAVRAVRLTVRTLEDFWLPAISLAEREAEARSGDAAGDREGRGGTNRRADGPGG